MDRLRIETTSPAARPPIRATSSSAGLDLSLPTDVTVRNRTITTVELPYKVAIPDGHVGILSLRSSLGTRGLTIPSGVGIIDSDYRGTLKLTISLLHDSGPVILRAGERVAQLAILPAVFPTPVEAAVNADETGRGAGGLGSTGTAALPTTEDAVNHPTHYTVYDPEPIVVAEHLSFCEGNVVKYLARAGRKPSAPAQQDLDKARWYMRRAACDKDGVFNKDALNTAAKNILAAIAALTPATSSLWQDVFDAALTLSLETEANA